MGLRGPPPKPTAVRILEGNPGRLPINRNEPKPSKLTNIEPPADLPEEGKRVFSALSRELINCGLMTAVDVEAFNRYIRLLLEYRKADSEIGGKFVFPVKDAKGQFSYFVPNPWVAVRDRALDRLLRLEREFGMTPASRVRMVALLTTDKPEKVLDPYGDDDDEY
jgi:P27 family predicted phage terminase small subunit